MSDFLNSLDPRINRLNIPAEFGTTFPSKENKDQFVTFEVFVQPKESKPYQHEGIVHAPTIDMAFLFAKEQFSRRGMSCSGVWVIKTDNIQVSPITENDEDIYDFIHEEIMEGAEKGKNEAYKVFHLKKRGKQHVHVGELEATSFEEALFNAKSKFQEEKAILNIWVAKEEDFLKIEGKEFTDIWETLPEKKYRDAMDYRATEKIKKFKAEQNA
ncbi:phenylacetic acid degradation b [Marivirga arenosa]|uniref:Phenylacetic acid degradation b n=1 Tax=Marivirga arenosa TaxID=3059076 RepID=A0AA51N6F3_9BACT|nr:phenylacetic acid degradation b [Marivirga sp. ABR2-2]WMN06883.1 phenylacetic acid degradation b [Marivirga sp. ABR2-2]